MSSACLGLAAAGVYWMSTAGAFVVDSDEAVAVAVEGEQGPPLRVVELFTSHGCSSCPRADRLLGEMLQEDDSLMALEYHVDYWDSLVHGNDGNWKDPFSRPEYTERQRTYNAAKLIGRGGVYTPQVVINGQYVAVGSNESRLRQALKQNIPAQLHIGIDATASDTSPAQRELSIQVEGDQARLSSLQGAQISLVRYIDQASTDITGGENNHKQLVNHRIVFDVASLGQVGSQSPMQYRVEAPGEGEGCLVMVQDAALTPILAAAQCP